MYNRYNPLGWNKLDVGIEKKYLFILSKWFDIHNET